MVARFAGAMSPHATTRVDVVVPRPQRRGRAGREHPDARRLPRHDAAVPRPGDRRRQARAPTAPRRSPASWPRRTRTSRRCSCRRRGRGLALRTAWLAKRRRTSSRTWDVDLSTNLNSFLPLVAPLVAGQQPGSRSARGLVRSAHVRRRLKARAALPRLQTASSGCSSAPASRTRSAASRPLRADAARQLVPHVARRRLVSSTPSCSCSRSATTCGSTRCRSTG